MSKKPTRGLGRGLSALMADVSEMPNKEGLDRRPEPRRADQIIPIEQIAPNPEQPRRMFTHAQLEELAASIREKGVIQPLILREKANGATQFEIVAGERRWRAAQMAQLHEVPALVRDYTDTEALEVAIIENIQRADLNPIEEAAGYRDLMDRFGHTQEKLAEALGKSRPYIANLLRLLSLPEDVQALLSAGDLTTGHARALVTASDPSGFAAQIVSKGLSVRETEKLVKSPKPAAQNKERSPSRPKDADTIALEQELSAALNMKVEIAHKNGRESGSMTIRYPDLDALDDLCRKLGS